MKTGLNSPFNHPVIPVRKASVIVSALISSGFLIFSSATVYGYQTGELQKISSQPIRMVLEEWEAEAELARIERAEDQASKEEAAEFVRKKQLEILQKQKQKEGVVPKPAPAKKQVQQQQPQTAPAAQNQNAGSEGGGSSDFNPQPPDWFVQSQQKSQAELEAYGSKNDAEMKAFDNQAKADLEAFKAESAAKIEAFKAENGM